MSTLPIALDAMGGDNAPDAIVDGAQRATHELGVTITLVGQPELVERLRCQARAHGRSVEAEHRAILRAALAPTDGGRS